MKRLMLVFALVLGLFAIPGIAVASDGVDIFSIVLTTGVVDGSDLVSDAPSRMPFDSGGTKRIVKIEVVSVSTTTDNTVTFYDTATSTTVISTAWAYTLTHDAAGTAVPAVVTKTYDFGNASNGYYYRVTDFYAKKSNVNCVTTLYYWYLK